MRARGPSFSSFSQAPQPICDQANPFWAAFWIAVRGFSVSSAQLHFSQFILFGKSDLSSNGLVAGMPSVCSCLFQDTQYITKSNKRVARSKLDNGTNAKQLLDEMGQEQGKTFEGEPKDVRTRTIVAQGKPDVAERHVGV